MKLRLLNGSHSAMAYLGAAAGCTTVADVLATEWGERLVRALRRGGRADPAAIDRASTPARYVDDLVARFRNPAMQHLLRQIGSDGSLKIPERWFPALRDAARGRRPRPRCSSWPWPAGSTPPGPATRRPAYGTTDPAAAALEPLLDGRADPRALVAALLRTVGADDLAEQADLTASVAARLPACGRTDRHLSTTGPRPPRPVLLPAGTGDRIQPAAGAPVTEQRSTR